MDRRTLLAIVGGGTLSLAGCTTGLDPGAAADGTGTPTPTDSDTPGTETPDPSTVPADCPTSQDLGVEWPTDLDAESVGSFVEAYERVYYREVVVEYEPQTRLDSYELDGSATAPTERGDGWVVSYSGGGGIYRPTLSLQASTTTPPEDADVVPGSEIDDDLLTELLAEAAETGAADRHIEPPGDRVERYNDLLASLSADFEPLTEPGDADSLYVEVDDTTVELSAEADSFHGDYWWKAWYYVDDRVLRRTTDEDTDPREGELLECRSAD